LVSKCTKSFVGWVFAPYANKRAHLFAYRGPNSTGKGNERTEVDGVGQRKGEKERERVRPKGHSRSVASVDSSVSYNKIYSYSYNILCGQFSFLFQLF